MCKPCGLTLRISTDRESEQTNPSLWKQMLQEDAWHIIQTTQNKRIYTAIGQYPCRTSGTFIVNRRSSQVIIVPPCLPSRYAVKIIPQGTVDGGRRRRRPCKSCRDNIKEWTGQPLSSLLRITDGKCRWATIAAEAFVRVPPMTLGRDGC